MRFDTRYRTSNFSSNLPAGVKWLLIANVGTLTLVNSTLSGNSAEEGGALYQYLATLTIQSSTLNDNSASTEGGGVYLDHWEPCCRDLGQLVREIQSCAANGAAHNYSVRLVLHANPQGAFLSIGESVGNDWPAGVRIFAVSVGKVARNIRSSVERAKLLDFTIHHDYIIGFWKG